MLALRYGHTGTKALLTIEVNLLGYPVRGHDGDFSVLCAFVGVVDGRGEEILALLYVIMNLGPPEYLQTKKRR